jgi:penicillin amidase
MAELGRRTWDEFIPPRDSVRVAVPSTAILLAALADSASPWWDDRRTSDRQEDRNIIVAEALGAAWETLVRRHGRPDSSAWTWGRTAPAAVNHLLGLRGFSRRDVAIQGGRGTLNPSAQRTGFGASWRMVVELGDSVQGIGTYPGGQSGNPASPRYDDRLPFWQRGELEPLFTPRALTGITDSLVRASLLLVRGGPP